MIDGAVVTPAGMRIIRLLVGNPPQTMAELVEQLGVTRTAVNEQLHELIRHGFVERTAERIGRGRPKHLYTATHAALAHLFANNQRLVAPAMLRAIDEIGGPELSAQVLQHASSRLSEHYRATITAKTPAERMKQLADLLRREGILVEINAQDGCLTLRQRTCPFIDMVDDSRAVCEVEKNMMAAVVGAPVDVEGCRLDGCPGCTFRIEVEMPAAGT